MFALIVVAALAISIATFGVAAKKTAAGAALAGKALKGGKVASKAGKIAMKGWQKANKTAIKSGLIRSAVGAVSAAITGDCPLVAMLEGLAWGIITGFAVGFASGIIEGALQPALDAAKEAVMDGIGRHTTHAAITLAKAKIGLSYGAVAIGTAVAGSIATTTESLIRYGEVDMTNVLISMVFAGVGGGVGMGFVGDNKALIKFVGEIIAAMLKGAEELIKLS